MVKNCPECNVEITGKYRNFKTFCSRLCYESNIKKFHLQQWLHGEVVGHKNTPNKDIKDFVRLYLLNKYNYSCAKCGFSGVNLVSGKTVLQIHHIDGNSENSTVDNLQVLCPNCHAMTETYMGLNRGNSKRNNRYGVVE